MADSKREKADSGSVMERVRLITYRDDLVNIEEQYLSQKKHPEYGPESRSTARSPARSTGVPPEYRSLFWSTGVLKDIIGSTTVML